VALGRGVVVVVVLVEVLTGFDVVGDTEVAAVQPAATTARTTNKADLAAGTSFIVASTPPAVRSPTFT
jgi:hypothetical protein